MRFLADESCDFAVVRALRAAKHDVVAVSETFSGSEDEAVIGLAVREARILLTEDKDFGRLIYASLKESSGVILIRYPATARTALPEAIIDLIKKKQEGLIGSFVVASPGLIRISQRP
jgi:predicted nuclease of predicted toxin-antitoxin system